MLQAGRIIWYIFQKLMSKSSIKNNRITERPSQTFTIYWTLAQSYSTTPRLSVIVVIATYQLLVSNHGMHSSANYEIYILLLIFKAKSESLFCSGTITLPHSFLMKIYAKFQVSCITKKVRFLSRILQTFLRVLDVKFLHAQFSCHTGRSDYKRYYVGGT